MHQIFFEQYVNGFQESPLDLLSIVTEAKYSQLASLDYIQGVCRFPERCHIASVNALALDSIDKRFLLSGGGDSSIKLWDLSSKEDTFAISKEEKADKIIKNNNRNRKLENGPIYEPAYIIPAHSVHKFGITHLKWWRDNGMWVSSSYDHSLKVFDSDTMQPVQSFDLKSRVLNFDFDPSGSSSQVACCLDGGVGGVKLVDLRTLADSQTLGGGGKQRGGFGYMLSCAWSPTDSNVLVSGGVDGYCIGWDIRAANGCLFKMDYNLTTGNYKNSDRKLLFYEDIPRAHNGGVNSLLFNETGTDLITLGTDERIRIWDLTTTNKPLNKSINFGPLVRNKSTQFVQMCLSPMLETEMQYLWFPSENGQMLVYRIQDGKLVCRLTRRGPGMQSSKMHTVVYGGHNSVRYYAGCHDGSISVWGYKNDTDFANEPLRIERDGNNDSADNAGEDNENDEESDNEGKTILDEIHDEMVGKWEK